MKWNRPFVICGAPGSGTSVVTKVLRHAGLFVGSDAGPKEARKFHESTAFRDANCKILQSTINFPFAPKSAKQFRRHLKRLHETLDEVVQSLELDKILSRYCQAELPVENWGWKDPRNSANILVWRQLFPDLRLIVIHKRWKWSERRTEGTLAGNWFRQESNYWVRRLYRSPPFSEGLDVFPLSLDRFLNSPTEFQRLAGWIGLGDFSENASRCVFEDAGVAF